jgi:uracil-DNA glycosylase family 4
MSDIDPENPCDGCPIISCRRKSKAKLGKNRPFLIVGKQPSTDSLRNDRILPPKAMETLTKYARKAGFTDKDFAWANSVRCDYDETKYPAAQRKEIETRCRHHLVNVINQAKPEVIIPLGKEAAKQVYGRAVKITKVRGVLNWSEEFNAQILAMQDPVLANQYPQNLAFLKSDLEALARMEGFEYDMNAVEEDRAGNYELIDDLQFLIDMDPEDLAFDVETQGLHPYDKDCELLTMQFSPEVGSGYLLSWDHPDRPMPLRKRKKIKQQLRELLCQKHRNIVGHNLKFDASWVLKKLGIHFRMGNDTLMMLACLNENLQNKDLDTAIKIYVPEMAGYADQFNAEIDKSNMREVPLDRVVGYGCGDTDASLRLYYTLKKELEKDPVLWNSYRMVSMPGLNAFLSFETDGMLIDEDSLDEFQEVLTEQVETDYQTLIEQVPTTITREFLDLKKPMNGLSFGRAAFVQAILFSHKDGFRLRPRVFTKSTENLEPQYRVPSTSTKDHLPFFFEECPFTFELAEYIKNKRILDANVIKFRDNYMHEGRIYPIYSLSQAVTGRTSSRDPNGQNFPKRGAAAKAYRKIFVPPPGYVQLEADLSQAELRIAADMSNDPTMINIYRNNGDIHTRTACIVMGCTEREFGQLEPDARSLARFKAKAVNFGFLYGMWWKKFVSYAKTQYGVEFTEQEAQAIRERFFQTYSRLGPWHNAMREFAMQKGYVRSYDGRVRHLPTVYSDTDYIQQGALRQAINSPVQEFASSLGVMSLARITQQIDPRFLKPVGFVHDAIYAWVPAQHVEWGAKMLKYYMESNPIQEWFNIKMKVPMVADVSFGMNGSKVFEMETLNLADDYNFDLHAEEMDFELPEQTWPENDGLLDLPEHLQAPEEIHLWT